MDESLLPCPFCGGKPMRDHDPGHGWWTTECTQCNCLMTEFHIHSEAEANAAWNRRDALSIPRSPFLPWTPEETARRFHEAYEIFAPMFGYKATEKSWADLPQQNKDLMIAVVRQVFIEQIPLSIPRQDALRREPTLAMQEAGMDAMFDSHGDLKRRELLHLVRKGWRAMYDAAIAAQPAKKPDAEGSTTTPNAKP